MVDLMVRPPTPGDASYTRWKGERDAIFNDMKKKSKLVYEKLNSITVSVRHNQHACMYVCMHHFPYLTIAH
jgi:hypothetical protein